jgi:hypothetical protein
MAVFAAGLTLASYLVREMGANRRIKVVVQSVERLATKQPIVALELAKSLGSGPLTRLSRLRWPPS